MKRCRLSLLSGSHGHSGLTGISLPLLALLAVSVVTMLHPLAAGHGAMAAETYQYVAETADQAGRQGSVVASGLQWQCSGKRCVISGSWATPGVGACQALAAQVGRIVSYGHSGKQLSVAQLEQCNQRVSTAAVSVQDTARQGSGGSTASPTPGPASSTAAASRALQDKHGIARDAQIARDTKQIEESGEAIRGGGQLPQGTGGLDRPGDAGLANRGGSKLATARGALSGQSQDSGAIQGSTNPMPAPTAPGAGEQASRPRSVVGPLANPRDAASGAAGTDPSGQTGVGASIEEGQSTATESGSETAGKGDSETRETTTDSQTGDVTRTITRTYAPGDSQHRTRQVYTHTSHSSGMVTETWNTTYESGRTARQERITMPPLDIRPTRDTSMSKDPNAAGNRWGSCNPLTGLCPDGPDDPNQVLPPRDGDGTTSTVQRIPKELQKKTYTDPSPEQGKMSGSGQAAQKPQSPDPGPKPPSP